MLVVCQTTSSSIRTISVVTFGNVNGDEDVLNRSIHSVLLYNIINLTVFFSPIGEFHVHLC